MTDPRTADTDIPHRRERAVIAAQACQTCRTRKSKCDEKRPRCGLCQRLDVECHYREPQPTKKDKTMVHILEALTRLETKFDNISVALPLSQSTPLEQWPTQGVSASQPPESQDKSNQRHFTDAHAILTWPCIYVHLVNASIPAAADLPNILQRGSIWFTQLQMSNHLSSLDPNVSLHSVVSSSRDGGVQSTSFPWLTPQQSQTYAEAYFHTFNVLHPILEQQSFLNDVAGPVMQQGHAIGDVKSVIALIVYALGQLAVESTLDEPVATFGDGQSGIRGGTIRNPPGLATFNEARKRMGLLSGEYSVANVQMHLLVATYFEAAGMHLEFWKSTLNASATCQLLVRSTSAHWDSGADQALKQLYWICHLNEMMCYSDLGLPPTDLSNLQDIVPFPSYSDNSASSQISGYDRPQHQYYFPAILSLERLIHEIRTTIIEPATQQTKTSAGMVGPSMPVVREMARKLDSWRSLLPRALQWLDSEMYDFPSTEYGVRRPADSLFSLDQGTVPIRHRYNLDITTAHLRSRFYHARHLIYQPLLYKVLHFSELLVKEDTECAALALQSALMWPVFMAPPKDKKRLLPYGFTWTQTCIGMLLIFKMTQVHDQLRSICEEQVDTSLVDKTVTLMLHWLRDVRQLDPIAEWAWQMLEPLILDAG